MLRFLVGVLVDTALTGAIVGTCCASRCAANAQAARGYVTIEILRIPESAFAFFDYLQRELPIEGLELISPSKEVESGSTMLRLGRSSAFN